MFAMPLRKQATSCEQSIWFQNDSSRALTPKQTGWASEVFALFHNGLRHELRDLSNMIERAMYRKHRFEEHELVAFEQWFVHFSYMVAMYFEAETNIVYPVLLEMRIGLLLAVEHQRARQMKVVQHLLEIHAECVMFTKSGTRAATRKFEAGKLGTRRCVDRISRLVNGLEESLEQIFSWEVRALTPVIQECLMQWEARGLVRRCLQQIVEHKVGRAVVWGYFRDLPDEVKEDHFAHMEPVRRFRLRVKERRWIKVHQKVKRRLAAIGDMPDAARDG